MGTAGKGTLFVYLQAAPPRGRLAGFYVWGAARRGSAPGPRWGLRPPRSSQRSLCVAAKAASFNSLAHWASASLYPPLAALGSAPLRWVFHRRQKTQQKARPFVQPSPAPSTTRKKVVATASRCETATPRRQQPSSAAGYRRRPPTAAVARISPSAQDRVAPKCRGLGLGRAYPGW